MNRVKQIFLNTDLRCQHRGLSLLAAKRKCNLDKLEPGEHVAFVNRRKDRVKLYSANGLLSYLKSDRPLDLRAIASIPEAFGKSLKLKYASGIRKLYESKTS